MTSQGIGRRRDSRMVWLLLFSLVLGCARTPTDEPKLELHGAGATFPAQLYRRWFDQVTRQRGDVNVTYDAVGSGAGVRQFIDEMVDFGASDEAMSDEAIAQVDRGVQSIPMTSGAIVVVYNLRDASGQKVADLKLSRQAVAEINLGRITRWNDPKIARHNPGVPLPDDPIQVEYRLDSSGTTLAFTHYLAAVSEEWKNGPGVGKLVNWPIGAGMPTDRGVVQAIRRVPGSIGYLSYTQAVQEKMAMAAVENKSGRFVKPTLEAMRAALATVKEIPDDLRITLIDPEGADVYPIVTFSWLLCYRTYDDQAKLNLVKEVVAYGLEGGQALSADLGYVPLPDEVRQRAVAALDRISLSTTADTAVTATTLPAAESAVSPIAPPVTRAAELVQEPEEEKRAAEGESENAATTENADDADAVKVESGAE